MDGHPEALIDLDAITANAAALAAHVGGAALMAVVKSDGYGHGMVPAARAAVTGGASWLGVVQLADAITLRQAGLTVPVLRLADARRPARGGHRRRRRPHRGHRGAGPADRRRRPAGRRGARIQLEADTGMGRGGATTADWPDVVAAARHAERAGHVGIARIWSDFACADVPGDDSVPAQLSAFRRPSTWPGGRAEPRSADGQHPGHAATGPVLLRPGPARRRGVRAATPPGGATDCCGRR